VKALEGEAVKVLEGEAVRPAPRLELDAARVTPPPIVSYLKGEVAVLLRGDEGLLDSSKAEEAVAEATGRGLGIAGLTASANSSRVTLLSPSASILLMTAMISASVATKPLSLRNVWRFL